MIDFKNLSSYRENNRIEAKKALGGFPHSLWETYSAFANTLGGIILLGVEELSDHSLRAVNLPDPQATVDFFLGKVNDKAEVSVNVLSAKDVAVEVVDGNKIVVINVPRAHRIDRPVYLGSNPFGGTYRRSGEGDYRCDDEEVRAMLRDREIKTPDMLMLSDMPLTALDGESVTHFCNLCKRAGHVGKGAKTECDILCDAGAAERGKDGEFHPTAAGLLMLGRGRDIAARFPRYYVRYTDKTSPYAAAKPKKGQRQENLLTFYCNVCGKIAEAVKGLPDPCGKGKEVIKALCEALANAIVNADYYGKRGIIAERRKGAFVFSNPGGFRIAVEKAKAGGVSDPRNIALTKMFNKIGVGEAAGSGIPSIYSLWKRLGWASPRITEKFSPERTTLTLPLTPAKSKRGKAPSGKTTLKDGARKAALKGEIIELLTDCASATQSRLLSFLGVSEAQLTSALSELLSENIIVCEGGETGRIYRLKR